MVTAMRCQFAMRVATVAICFLLCATVAAAGAVETLTSANFESVLAKEPLLFVKWMAPWCGHCKELVEPYEKAAAELKGRAVLAEVDATKEESLSKKYNVDGYPTLKLFSNGEEIADYKGNRDYVSMVKFIDRASKPAFDVHETAAPYDTFVADNLAKYIVVGVGLDAAGKASFTKSLFALLDVFPDSVAFTAVKEGSVAATSAPRLVDGDVLLLTPPASGDGPSFVTKWDPTQFDSVDKFVKVYTMPAFGEFTEDNAELYTELGTPVIVGFFKDETQATDPNFAVLSAIANKKKGNGKVNFVWASSDNLDSFQDYVGLKNAKVAVCGYSFESDEKFLLPDGTKKLSEAAFESFVDDFIAGKINAVTKSQPVPKTQPETGPYIVVADSWASIVEDETKDVFVAQIASQVTRVSTAVLFLIWVVCDKSNRSHLPVATLFRRLLQ
jgi:protein disulfide-isomerase A1